VSAASIDAAAAPLQGDARANHWDLLRTLVVRNLWIRSKRSMLGMAWPALSPLVMLALYSYVFRRVFDVPIERYPEFLFAGLLPWAFLSQSIGAALASLSAEAMLIRRAKFPFEYVPLAMVLSQAIYLVAGVLGFAAYLAWHGRLDWALAPLLLVPTLAVVLFTSGLGQLLALFDVYNRDLRWVVGNVLTIWFFLVPIVYRQQMAPDGMLFLRSVDPMNMIIGQYRDILYYGDIHRWDHLALMLVVCVVFFLGSGVIFRRLGRDLSKDV
jgi:ABC-type polysaccharide/polyol phosphate export permease